MSTQLLYAPTDSTAIGPASRYVRETSAAALAYETDELASLRLSIILTARWEASRDEDPERRAELREELTLLRKQYGDKVDEIAMNFGVQQAMRTKAEVERTVIVPRETKPLAMNESDQGDYSEEDELGKFGL